MKITKLNELLALTANLGVIVGIFFLVVELQQTNDLMRAEARAVRAQNRMENNRQIFSNPPLARAIEKAIAGEELTRIEQIMLTNLANSNIISWQLTFQDYQAGLLDEVDLPLDTWLDYLRTNNSYKNAWENRRENQWRPDFVNFINENLQK